MRPGRAQGEVADLTKQVHVSEVKILEKQNQLQEG